MKQFWDRHTYGSSILKTVKLFLKTVQAEARFTNHRIFNLRSWRSGITPQLCKKCPPQQLLIIDLWFEIINYCLRLYQVLFNSLKKAASSSRWKFWNKTFFTVGEQEIFYYESTDGPKFVSLVTIFLSEMSTMVTINSRSHIPIRFKKPNCEEFQKIQQMGFRSYLERVIRFLLSSQILVVLAFNPCIFANLISIERRTVVFW